MRDLVGRKLKLVVEGFPQPMSGTLVDENQTFAYIQSAVKEDEVWRIPKGKICGFMSPDAPTKFLPFHVLFCDNQGQKCKGVQFIKEGEGFSHRDLDTFMSQCPSRNLDCRCGSKGELRTVDSELLKRMFTGVLFGDYPEAKGKKNARSSPEVELSQSGDRKADKGRKPSARRTEQPSKTANGTGSQV